LSICGTISKSSLTYHREIGNRSLACFVKSQIDAFDEGLLSHVSNREVSIAVLESANDTDSIQVDPPNASHDDTPPLPEDETPGGGVMHRQSRTSFARQHEIRVSRIVSALGASGIPFSRVAYGASKTDRMRVEAELVQFEGSTLDHFFDDDETIATTSTFQVSSMTTPKEQSKSYHRHESLRGSLNSLKSSISMDDTTRRSSVSMDDLMDNSILRDSAAASSTAKGHTQSSKSIGDTGAYFHFDTSLFRHVNSAYLLTPASFRFCQASEICCASNASTVRRAIDFQHFGAHTLKFFIWGKQYCRRVQPRSHSVA
jgi:hypothetical protein